MEYWIGFNGKFADNLLKEGFISKSKPIFNVHLHEEIVDLGSSLYVYNSGYSRGAFARSASPFIEIRYAEVLRH